MIFSLQHKVVVVTGGGSGIGKAIAECFAKQGAQVCIADISDEAASKAAADIRAIGGKAEGYTCSVVSQKELATLVEHVVLDYKSIDILVCSAGIASVSKLDSTGEETFDMIFQVNVKGTYNAMHAVISQMKEQRRGVILNIASIAATVGLSERFAYSMSKGAVVSMTLSVAKDYVKDGIRCNCISPARVHTPFVDGFLKKNYPGKEDEMFQRLSKTQPIGRMASPEEIAFLALYLCSDEASFVTGCDYPIDGGFIKLSGQ